MKFYDNEFFEVLESVIINKANSKFTNLMNNPTNENYIKNKCVDEVDFWKLLFIKEHEANKTLISVINKLTDNLS